MKKITRFSFLIAAVLALLAFDVSAQTVAPTNAPASSGLPASLSQIASAVSSSQILKATNYSFEPYGTYASHNAANAKWGGGILAVYNVNDYAGLGLGADYLGQFSLVSANLSLKVPTHPLTFTGWSWATNLVVTPFVLAGVGTPLSGSPSSATTIEDAGGYIQLGHLWGGQFNIGGCYGQWNNAGDYSGKRAHLFAGWSHGF